MLAVWRVLGSRWFQRWIAPRGSILDIGAGSGLFLRSVTAARKTGVDFRPRPPGLAPDVEWRQGSWRDLGPDSRRYDAVFASNVLEHLRDREELLDLAEFVAGILSPGGVWLILGPNIRYAGGRYWDFVDHGIALTDRSVVELVTMCGLTAELVIPRFLPFTSKSRLPRHPLLVHAYLANPWAWRLLGGQYFVVARKPGGERSEA